MQKQFIFFITNLFIFVFSLVSCRVQEGNGNNTNADSSLLIHYANGFSVSYYPDYKRVEVFNPWRNNTSLCVYYLVSDSTLKTPDDGIRIQIPLQTLGITSCTHIEFLNLLGVLSTVKGATMPELIYNQTLQQAFQQGKLIHLGDAFKINVEKLLLFNPDALMVSNHSDQSDENTRNLQNTDIKLIYNNEWLEKSPLARAEWIKFVAVFYNRESLADSIFQAIENRYNQAKIVASNVKRKPNILSGGNFKGTWYMPSGRVFMSRFFTDAGGDYYYANDTNTGSLPLTFETVLLHHQHADVWLDAQANSMAELLAQDQRHLLFDAVKNKKVYNFNARSNEKGANDFWESAVARPDIVLYDIIWALHPDLITDYTPIYIKQLE